MSGTSQRRASRRLAPGAFVAGALLPLVTACGAAQHPSSSASTPTTSTHDSAWVDAAIAQAGIAAGHDPVVRVELDPAGATITTRRADSRVQRTWRVDLASATPSAGATLSPSATRTPSTTVSAGATGTPSASTTPSADTTAGSTSSARTSASPTPVFPKPSGAVATPVATARVDNSSGNMSLGSFGDLQVRPMWERLQAQGCTGTGWQIVATSGWLGTPITRGTCHARTTTMVDGKLLPATSNLQEQLVQQLAVVDSVTPNQVVRLVITRTGRAACPTTMTADYVVSLGGSLPLRTSVTCTTVTTTMLSNGWLPSAGFDVAQVHAEGIEAVEKDLAAHKQSTLGASLRVQWSGLYQQVVIAPASVASGRPTWGLDGVRKK